MLARGLFRPIEVRRHNRYAVPASFSAMIQSRGSTVGVAAVAPAFAVALAVALALGDSIAAGSVQRLSSSGVDGGRRVHLSVI